MNPVKFALAGVGNVASALVQGIVREAKIQGQKLQIQPVLGFDVHERKVGRILAEAIRVAPNCAAWLDEDLGNLEASVVRGPLLDGLSPDLRRVIPVDDNQKPVDIAEALNAAGAEVLVIVLPTGSQKAAEEYAQGALEAKVGIVNGMPASIAKLPEIAQLSSAKGLAVLGDDVKSQVGATIVHRALMDVFRTRDARVHRTLQLDWGGDTDFMNLVPGGRYNEGKKTSKTEAVVWNHPNTEVHISACDYIPFLGNVKEAYTRLEGTIFAGAKVRIDMMMSVDDAYNSAGILAQAIQCTGLATRRRFGGVLQAPSAWFCKHPPVQMSDAKARRGYLQFMKSILSEPTP